MADYGYFVESPNTPYSVESYFKDFALGYDHPGFMESLG